ncbi:S8 family serine peptidase [Nocardioides sp. C4-1]|uniref:S8 family serine peptidase n=1 Tax=Nocardioides sp. C4-1 TaxID=3151851 RepID=UPI0032644E27
MRLATLVAGPVAALLATTTLAVAGPSSAQPVVAARGEQAPLYLVSLVSPGASGVPGPLARPVVAEQVAAEQDDLLAGIGSPPTAYRWTTALNGFAARLTPEQVAALRASGAVAAVERDSVRPMAAVAAPDAAPLRGLRASPDRGGDGVVVGVVDSGIAPDSPVFSQRTANRGRVPFTGTCDAGPSWDPAECNGKIVGASHYVDGFGPDRLRASSSVSPRDDHGHGTRTASLVAGNAHVPVQVDGERVGAFGGQAPDARLAIYKACWSAPDPADDGCSAADLVSAVDAATADGVDVLTLAVGGPSRVDVLERALLGATEGGVVVVAAAGNRGAGSVAHATPWVVTVGASTADVPRGRVVLPDGRRLAGAMLARRSVGPARVVRAVDAVADGSTRSAARRCVPGSLDAARVADAVVLCDRGGVGRVDKSRAVALADGVAMVLLNRGRGSIDADVHSVPTVHLGQAQSRALSRWARRHPAGRVRLEPRGVLDRRARVAAFSGSAGRGSGLVKPDLVAAATGVVAAAPGGSWSVASGTSAATARAAGVAATLLARGLTPAEVRSALVTTARPQGDAVRRSGAGVLQPRRARRPGLAVLADADDYRAWLDGSRRRVNTPSIALTDGRLVARRTITNTTRRSLYFSSSAEGFRRSVTVTPAAVRLGPGESATFRVRVADGGPRTDDGYVVWRGATGTRTSLPVVVGR